MKLLTFRPLLQDKAQGLRIGALTEDGTQVVDLQKALEARQGHGATYFDYMIAFWVFFGSVLDNWRAQTHCKTLCFRCFFVERYSCRMIVTGSSSWRSSGSSGGFLALLGRFLGHIWGI